MKERQLSCGGDQGAEGKAPLQHRKSGNKDLGKVLIELKMPLPVAEGLDSMALRGLFHPKPFCDSVIPKDQPGRSHTAKGFSSHQEFTPQDMQGCIPSPREELPLYFISQGMQHAPQPLPHSCHSAASQQGGFWTQAKFCMEYS